MALSGALIEDTDGLEALRAEWDASGSVLVRLLRSLVPRLSECGLNAGAGLRAQTSLIDRIEWDTD